MEFDPALFFNKAVAFLRSTLATAGYSRVTIAVSGGVDSAVVLSLCVRALCCDSVVAVFLPCGMSDKDSLRRSRELVSSVGLSQKSVYTVDIQKTVNAGMAYDSNISAERRGNIMARVRMILLYDIARKEEALVVGTENRSEYLLGYFTRFGDEASDIELIRSLYKTQVYALARYLHVPSSILEASPTAGLWNDQTDEKELGFSYADADPILRLLYDKKQSFEKVAQQGYLKKLIEKIGSHVEKNNFKHNVPHVFSYEQI